MPRFPLPTHLQGHVTLATQKNVASDPMSLRVALFANEPAARADILHDPGDGDDLIDRHVRASTTGQLKVRENSGELRQQLVEGHLLPVGEVTFDQYLEKNHGQI